MNEISHQDHFSYFLEMLNIHLDLFSEQNEKVSLEKNCDKFGYFKITLQILILITAFIFAGLT